MLDLLDAKTGRGFVLDDEALNLVIRQIARPDDREVAPGSIPDPPFLAVEDPGIAIAFSGRRQSAGCSRADQRLGQAETTDLFEARHLRQPFLFLLFRAVEVDRAHRQAIVNTKKRSDRRVDPRQFHHDEAEQFLASTPASVSVQAEPTDLELFERGY